ncbi:MAG: choice-of-anchor D domain-containing protein [Sandaracinus sp.]
MLGAALLAVAGCNCDSNPTVDAGVPFDAPIAPPDAFVAAAELTISPALSDFGDVVVGETSSATTFTVTNVGTGSTSALSATFGGSGASDFRFATNTCAGMRLAPDDTCTISVEFRPTAEGGSSATLTVAGGDVSAVATLEGNGARNAGLAITPTPYNFGDAVIGMPTAPHEFTVRNTGEATSGNLDITISGLDGSQFELGADTCSGNTIAAGATCTVEVIYNPTTSGVHMGTLQATADPGSTATAALQGRAATEASLRLLPGSQNFGSVVTGSSSTDVTFTLSNPGGVATGTITHMFTGANAAEFSIVSSTCAGAPLAGLASCTIVVRFNATTAGDKTASLDVTDGTLTASASLTATAVTPGSLIFEPSTRDFGDSALGSPTGATTFTLRNTGGSATTAITVAVAGANAADFPIVSGGDGCSGAVLPAAGTCTVAVLFNPTASGGRSATLRAQAATGSPATAALTGNGVVAAAIEVTPTAADFGSVATGASSSNVSFTVRNTGGAPTTIPTVSLTGVQSTQWSIVSNGCTASIPGGGTCDVVLRFSPTSTGGKTAVLNVTATTGGSDTSDLSGMGISPAAVSLTPTAVAFGQVAETTTGVQSVIVSNSGAEAITALSSSVTGTGYSILPSSTCTTTLAGGGNCRLDIQFAPAQGAAGGANPGTDVAGTLSVSATPAGSPAIMLTAALSATAIPDLRITPQGGDAFASVIIGETATREYLITNNTGVAVTGFTVAPPSTPAAEWNRVPASASDCGATLAAASSCRVALRLIPAGTPGARTVNLVVSGTTTGPVTETLAVNGTARGALRWTGWRLSFDGAANCPVGTCPFSGTFPAAFGNRALGRLYEITLRATNERPSTATTQITTSPSFTGAMNIVSDNCSGQTVAGGGTCDVVVRYYPQTAGTSASGNVQLLTGSGGTLQTTPNPTTPMVTGAAILGATITVTPTGSVAAPVDFGTVVATRSADQVFTVRNTGAVATGPLSIGLENFGTPAEFTIVAGGMGACVAGSTLAAAGAMGDTCTVTIRFAPSQAAATGVDNNRLFTVSQPGQAVTTSLRARVGSQLTLTPATLVTLTTASGTTSAVQPFTVTNVGTTAIAAVTVAVTDAGGAVAFNFPLTGNTCAGLAAGATCTFNVAFAPTAPGTVNREVRVSNAAYVPNVARVAMTPIRGVSQNPAALVVSPTSGSGWSGAVSFGWVATGSVTSPLTFTVRNTGDVPTGPISVSIDLASPFSCYGNPTTSRDWFEVVSTTCSGPLAGGATCTATLRGRGPAAEPNCIASWTWRATDGAVSGVGNIEVASIGATGLLVTPSAYDFGTVVGGTVSAAQTFTVTNGSAATVSITSAPAIPAPFALVGGSNTCTVGRNLLPGDTCSYGVTFNPVAGMPGIYQRTVTMNGSGGFNSNGSVLGTAVNPAALGLSPADAAPDYPNTVAGETSTITYTLSNTGGVSTAMAPAITLTGADPGQFSIPAAANTCTAALTAAGTGPTERCTFDVVFAPTGAGARTATVNINAGGTATATRNLSATGVGAGVLGISPSAPTVCADRTAGTGTLDFAVCQTYTITNGGGSPTQPLSLAVTGDFRIQDNSTCIPVADRGPGTTTGAASRTGVSLPATGANTCTVIVQYTPQAVGADSGVLTVGATGIANVTASLSGNGLSALVLTSGSPAFGPTPSGSGMGVTRTFRFTNQGEPTTGTLTYAITGTAFDVTADTCSGVALARTGFCDISVRFVPTGAAGSYSETLTVTDGTAEKRAVVTMTGSGT